MYSLKRTLDNPMCMYMVASRDCLKNEMTELD